MGRYRDLGRCVDCGEARMVKHNEWIRASRPRCYGCGGSLEPSDTAADEHVDHNAALTEDRAIRDRKTGRTK
jgi:uncharacterized protein with PIN domain